MVFLLRCRVWFWKGMLDGRFLLGLPSWKFCFEMDKKMD